MSTDALTRRGLNFIVTPQSGTLSVTGGAATTYVLGTAMDWTFNGKWRTQKASGSGLATPTTDHNTGLAFPPLVGGASVTNATGQGANIVWGLDTKDSDAVVCMQGPIQNLDIQGNFSKAPLMPAVPGDVVPFAYQVLKAGNTASATAIIFGTANWNATGFTNVIVDVAVLPDKPQVD